MSLLRLLIRKARDVPLRDLLISVWVMFTFVVAQPLLDLLGRNPEFFLARAAPSLDILVVVFVLLVGLPAVLGLVVAAARAISPTLGVATHALVLVACGTALAVMVMASTPAATLPGGLQLLLGVPIGAAFWVAFARWSGARAIYRIAAVGPLVFAALFLVVSPTSQLIFSAGAIDRPAGVDVANPVPLVVVLFDEFPVATLMNPEGEIPEALYPSFARLTREGIWFRNAVGVEQQTEEAVPTILTGRHPSDRDAIPTAADYPLNLFSLLSDTYEIRAFETVTDLCPDYACSNRVRVVPPIPARWAALASDLSVVVGHIILPDDLSEKLPPIAMTWGDFAGAASEARDDFNLIRRFLENVDADRRVEVERFLAALEEPTDQPTLYFAHLLFPHLPWTYLPTGQSYPARSPAPGSTSTGWESDEWLVMQGQQRLLLQAQYSDTIVGRVIESLERAGIYDDALLVILADHGTADIPNVEHRRVITPETIGNIAAVPLFIKLPQSETVGIDDYRAETTDVLPTIADVLGVDIPWRVDGISLVSPDRPRRESSTMVGSQGPVTFGVDGKEKYEVARWLASWFGDQGPFGLAPPGQRDLLGRTLDDLQPVDEPGLTATISNPQRYANVQPDADSLPAQINGTLSRTAGFDGDVIVAVVFNGRVEAVVRTYDTEGSVTRFQAMIPPDAFIPGRNTIQLVLVEGVGSDREFFLASQP